MRALIYGRNMENSTLQVLENIRPIKTNLDIHFVDHVDNTAFYS